MTNESKAKSSKSSEPGQYDNRSKLARKMEENPFVPIGVGGAIGMIAYQLLNYKNKPSNLKTSVYVIHTRVLAQGTIVAALTIGALYQLYSGRR